MLDFGNLEIFNPNHRKRWVKAHFVGLTKSWKLIPKSQRFPCKSLRKKRAQIFAGVFALVGNLTISGKLHAYGQIVPDFEWKSGNSNWGTKSKPPNIIWVTNVSFLVKRHLKKSRSKSESKWNLSKMNMWHDGNKGPKLKTWYYLVLWYKKWIWFFINHFFCIFNTCFQ